MEKQVNSLLAEATQHAWAAEALKPEMKLAQEIGLTSLQFILLALKLEEQFGVPVVKAENIASITTVGELHQAVRDQLAASNP